MDERHLTDHEKRFALAPSTRLALLVDLHPGKSWDGYPDEDWGPYSRPTDLELINNAIHTGGRVGANGDVYRDLVERFRRERMPAFGGKCAICRLEAKDVQIDHLWPVSRYPELVATIENLAPVCRECNMAKGWREPSDDELAFVERLTGLATPSPIEWDYRPSPPLGSTFIRGLDT